MNEYTHCGYILRPYVVLIVLLVLWLCLKTLVYDSLQSISSIVNALVQMCRINSKTKICHSAMLVFLLPCSSLPT